ncbi:pyridoxal 5'-phosphate synthase glutaminase subunit PdxT [Actinomyces succiniciruminis]|uniref:glutaminase n=1 Tax=Actinomyces succiniciruminis TaxID=1522002 RepID=A0A1L7RDV7_9ACTO|nr:pyridoxal 5'-phosphate synthase glutaminase subunit PdxT [Actinomyces succiniciruminis]CED92215.1 Glutamine amidotransferase subunit PdxT [Actinomyces succiniciruminis]
MSGRVVGVLALQGGVAEHARMIEALGHRPRPVRRIGDLEGIEALVLPGGESTTLHRLLTAFDLTEGIRDAARRVPTLGTCAGVILLATLGVLDVDVERNAFGPQADSATARLPWKDGSVVAAFIRAPRVTRVGGGVRVCSTWQGGGRYGAEPAIVGVEQGEGEQRIIGVSFHPELTGDTTIHRDLLD